jgi:hypothetical protein
MILEAERDCATALWFETRGLAALLTMRVWLHATQNASS